MPQTSIEDKQAALELTTLRKGDEGEHVLQLQEHLKVCGFDCGEADGRLGERTEEALIHLQQHFGLPADGIFDADDWYALSFWAEDEFASPDEAVEGLLNRLRNLLSSIQTFTLKPLEIFPRFKQQ